MNLEILTPVEKPVSKSKEAVPLELEIKTVPDTAEEEVKPSTVSGYLLEAIRLVREVAGEGLHFVNINRASTRD